MTEGKINYIISAKKSNYNIMEWWNGMIWIESELELRSLKSIMVHNLLPFCKEINAPIR